MLNPEKSPLSPFDSTQSTILSDSQNILREIIDEIQKFGLTRNQAKVFAYLEMFGPRPSPEVCRSLKLPRTETYGILNDLQRMGIVVANAGHPIKYSSVAISDALKIIINSAQERVNELSKNETKITNLWKKISNVTADTKTAEETEEGFQMLQGSSRIFNKMKIMIEQTEKECKLFATEKDISKFYYSDFIELVSSLRKDLKIIVPASEKLPMFLRAFDQSKIRLLPKEIENQCFLVKDNKEAIIFLRNFKFPSNNTLALWTNADSIIQSMNSLFDYSWTGSIPLSFEKFLQN